MRKKPTRSELKKRQRAPLATPTDLKPAATRDISGVLNALLADVYATYFKTKNFHWHLSGPHFRDYHLMLDEQASQLFAMTDTIAERVRKVGGSTLRSIGHVGRLRLAHGICDKHRDIASASFIEAWSDETEQRTWFLFEAGRRQ